ncbi:MAG: DUF1667 domain-containing protein [Eubacteriales bacterium]|nr:DUF1667 domain-containing protein [Eubacteriales bacterium]
MRELVCICCPLGCRLQVEQPIDDVQSAAALQVTGNRCPRGKAYAISELTDPRRTVTTTIKVSGGSRPCVSVKTVDPVPKDRLREVVRSLATIEAKAPIAIGDVLAENVADTGIAVVATADLPKAAG